MKDLKNCPFCGWPKSQAFGSPGAYWVECADCAAQGPMEDTEAEAIAAWSRRPEGSAEGWIRVDERNPEKNVEVLIAFRDTPLPATGQYTASPHDTWGWSFPAENDPDDTGPIIAWQPLPEHPSPQPGWDASPVKAGQAEEFEEICREFEVDPNTGWGGICRQFYIRGRAER